jgi:cell division septum initiation protein DivIVA
VAQAGQEADRILSEAKGQADQVTSRAELEATDVLARGETRARRIREDAESLVKVVGDYRQQWRRDPALLRQRLVALALTEVLPDVEEVFLLGRGPLRLQLERDTGAVRESIRDRERERFRQVHGGE